MSISRLPEVLKSKRESKGLSQTEVADSIGKSLRAYQYYEDGKKAPREATLQDLARVLDFNLTEIYTAAPKLHNNEPIETIDDDQLRVMLKTLLQGMEQLTRSRLIDSEANKLDKESRLIDSRSIARLIEMVGGKTDISTEGSATRETKTPADLIIKNPAEAGFKF